MFVNSITFGFIIVIVYVVYYLIKRKYNYWKKRNVASAEPSFLFGNYKDYLFVKNYIGNIDQEICRKFPREPYIGSYYGTSPALIVQDPELVKLIMTKDFYHFNAREITEYCNREPVTKSMFFDSGDNWKIIRQNLTSIFSSSKMKNMFHLIQNCRDTLELVLEKEISVSPQVEAKTFATRYIMDCIGSCVFGINTEVLTNNDNSNPFAMIGKAIFNTSRYSGMKMVCRTMWPSIFYGLRFQCWPVEVHAFFYQTLIAVFKSRDYKPTSRNDFIDLLMAWKNNSFLTGTSLDPKSEKKVKIKVNDDLLVAQCILFFGAGFETSSSVISFVLFELAKDKNAQKKAIQEVDEYFLKTNGKVEYGCITKLPYLEACINEAMRLYPLFGIIPRETMESYTLPTGLHLEKGLRVHIPVYHLHHNPEYFPDPETFRPERFLGEEKNNILPYTFMPFGEGPRLCIGMRFSKMQMYPAFLTLFKDYAIELADGMPSKIEFAPSGFVTIAADNINLKLTKRNKSNLF